MYFYTFATIGSLKPFISKICFRIFPRITILSSYCCFVVFSLFSFQGAVPCNIRWYCVVGLNGFEPSTSRLSGVRSNHLSYKPMYKESISWWRWGESNSWPPACKAGALPAELHPHIGFIFCLGLLIQLMNADPFRWAFIVMLIFPLSVWSDRQV